MLGKRSNLPASVGIARIHYSGDLAQLGGPLAVFIGF